MRHSVVNLDTIKDVSRQEPVKIYRPCLVEYKPSDALGKGQKVLVVCIGQNFMEGVADSIVAASNEYMRVNQAPCDIYVLQSLTVLPPLGLGEMHNLAIMKAYLENYSHVMLIHNDVLLDDSQIIIKLMNRAKGFIVPLFKQVYREGPAEVIQWPMFNMDQGLRELAWTVPYCVLYDMDIFRSGRVDVRCFTPTMLYNEDEINSVYMRCHGITLWQDTDVKVKLLRGPGMLCDTLEGLKLAKPFEMP